MIYTSIICIEIPQATASHDTFWDWITQNQELAHMVMWAMSDRAIPRSFRMMEGFGVNTYRFINEEGKAHAREHNVRWL